MASLVDTLLARASIILQDVGATRWPAAEMIGWLADGLRELIALKPDAKVKTVQVTLAQGARQTVPDDCYALTGVIGLDGAAVTPCARSILDAFSPNWQADTDSTVIHFMWEPTEPRIFYVYPAQDAAGTEVSLTYSAYPVAPAVGGTLDVQDQYVNRLLDYILHRAFCKDAEFPGAAARATAHYGAFSRA